MERYAPPSLFLQSVIAEESPLEGELGAQNLEQLFRLMTDGEEANRDWATFLLSQTDFDTTEVRTALLAAAEDQSAIVRAEAISGLAKRDKALALPLVRRELMAESVWVPLLEAAEQLADPSLCDLLEPFMTPSDDKYFDSMVEDAFRACKAAS